MLEAIYTRVRDLIQANFSGNGEVGEHGGSGRTSLAEEQPLRAELFSIDQLERHANSLAGWHQIAPGRPAEHLLPRLDENEEVLLHAYELVTAAVERDRRIAPASEWLLDNFYLIEEQIRTTRRHLPPRYSRELPRLANGPRAGYPRVYDIALELIQHVDGRVDDRSLNSFVRAYQSIKPLKLGELWAIPIMLRLALLENLRRVAARIASGRTDRDFADHWAEKLLDTAEKNPAELILIVADMARTNPPFSSAFVTEFTRRLQGQNPNLAFAITWVEQRLSEQGMAVDTLVQAESHEQAADQVSIGNSIGSLRFLGSMDWRDFVETHSVVEQVLLADPAGVYPQMDFGTRDRYRHVVELTARYSKLSEAQVAHEAISLARAGAVARGPNDRRAHVGFHLLGPGRGTLERGAKMRLSLGRLLARIGERSPLLLYLDAILLLTVGFCVGAFKVASATGVPGWKLAAFGILPFLAAMQLAIALVNWLSSAFVAPRPLPRMDFSERIPADHRTMVVVPTMLTGAQTIDDLIEGLEIRYLANRDDSLHFALLTDFTDAATETTPEDDALVRRATEGIEGLNAKYASDRGNIFFLFHRPRRWNESEGAWMGYERKRGKLAEFNSILRGGDRSRFSVILGNARILSRVRHVITLDTDTQLPRGAARELVGTMAHPLNRPVYDARKGRVVAGYTILQPRVAVSLPSANRSWFVRLFAGDAGIDPYTRSVSDVYQDLFQEGSFIGKGIYDVDAFEESLAARFPENKILSHDLLEGNYARSALVSDVQLYEEHPSRYPADVSRRHRWIRGDWQIGAWILPRVPGPNGQSAANPLSGLGRWKIFDNLRRSVTAPAMVLLLLCAWLFVLGPVGFWTMFVLGVVFLPPVLMSLVELLRKPEDLPIGLHLRSVTASALRQLAQALFAVLFLPYEAYVSVDAIVRTLFRMRLSKKKLLEWQTANDAERNAHTDLRGFYQSMWVAPALAVLGAVLLPIIGRHDSLWISLPFLALWFVSPAVAWFISRPLVSRRALLQPEQTLFLEKLARRTWRFFETFVNDQEHWLPPDNFQEHPVAVVASRTSPTNIGMALLSNLAAYDFGYIPVSTLIDRTDKTLTTVEGMEKYRNHLFNWYDTRTLRPLSPLYVSTVDSGNFAGHLLTLRAGLLELADHKILPNRAFIGLRDTARVLSDAARNLNQPAQEDARYVTPPSAVLSRIDTVVSITAGTPATLAGALAVLEKLVAAASDVAVATSASKQTDLKYWAKALERDARAHRDELVFIAPWVTQLPIPPGLRNTGLATALAKLETPPTLREVAEMRQNLLPQLDDALSGKPTGASEAWLAELRRRVALGSERAATRLASLESLAQRAQELSNMDFVFLLDVSRDLMSIGYNVTDHRMDNSFYDLLASEARLTSFIAIAQGQATKEHWFALGRLLTTSGSQQALLSWSGSAFEYLMPLLVMPTYEGTLLDQTCRAVVARQIEYGKQRGVPWGISESGYNTTDVHLNYQYRAFGVPGLGFKRGLGEDLVIAPYACVMSLMVDPVASCKNLQRLAAEGREGAFGMYEAVDYTPSRVPAGQTSATVRSFMAHHQGMSLLSLDYALNDRPMQRRFESDPLFKATELLLQERVPKAAPIHPHASEVSGAGRGMPDHEGTLRVFTNPITPTPEIHLLSNGNYHVCISSAGGGYSRWRDLAVTRWREDPTRDCWGQFCYIRDVQSGEFWSTAFQPTLITGKTYEAIFSQAKAEFRRRDSEISTHVEIAVSPEADIELRRVKLTNWSPGTRTIELTSYGEVVIAPPNSDAAHPAFSNLFVQTEIIPQHAAILATRRARSAGENPPWMVHLISVNGETVGEPTYETDRSKFVGRGRTLGEPAAMLAPRLGNSQGPVLDPIVSIRRTVRLAYEGTATIDIVTGMAETREGAMAIAERYKDPNLAERVFGLAWTHSTVVHRHLNIEEADAQVYGRLAGSVVYPTNLRRAAPSVLAKNRRGQSGLWGYGISGDLPIVLLRIGDTSKIDLVKQSLRAHAYWRRKGLVCDLVIWNEDHSAYRQALHDVIMGLIAAGAEANLVDKPGGIFVRRADQMSDEDRFLMQTVARVVLTDTAGTLSEQVERRSARETSIPRLSPLRPRRVEPPPVAVEVQKQELLFYNGMGGFTRDGREYIITTGVGNVTPAPWVNVIANESFGTVISESGPAYTWCENSHEFRLTPWHNDPVGDTAGEAFYLRDEETGRYWSPTPLPARGGMPYTTRHGFGYSIFEYTENGIDSSLSVYVATDAPVKFSVLKVRNVSGRRRNLSASGYFEWVLGELRAKSLLHVVTEIDPRSGAIFARNPYNTDFAERVAFLDVNEPLRSVTGDRTEFLGRNGSPTAPAAMGRTRLSGKIGAGLDPCAAVQIPFDLADGQEREIVFLLGCGSSTEDAQNLIQRFRGSSNAYRALQDVWDFWNHTLGVVWMETPDPAVNLLGNGWLVYQVLACRLWARTGFYQSGGAFGFRDQLQDVMALLHAQPRLLRKHLLRAAEHQFKDGDVQHWWHPPQGRGVRTHFSDDYLWLPYAVCRYVLGTNDTGVLDEKVNFIDGRPVNPNEEAYYDLPQRADPGTLYEHCVRAINNGLKTGEHGLPLMGCGDWNDGMNLVGEHGKGESVWLAFFLYDVLQEFGELARRRGDAAFADKCVAQANTLKTNIEQQAWDGSWYRRAYFDDGAPLGSQSNAECQIDALPQSWSVLSGAGDPERQKLAMEAVDARLIKRNTGIIQLFDPPFDKSTLNPGYIKGYVPGVRENGGQYTHAAVWTVMAYAAMHDRKRAWELATLINPINHAASAKQVGVYKVEPYVIAADVYAASPHTGRGGWTWYTGSAGWMYRLITESLLGITVEVDKLRVAPLLPEGWKGLKLHYRFRETFYHIAVSATGPGTMLKRVSLDGNDQPDLAIPMRDDRIDHRVEVEVG